MPSPGDVVLLPADGAAETKVRPVVVLSTNLYHATRPDIVVGLLTSQVARATDPTDYQLLDWSAAGLNKPTAFRAYLFTKSPRDIRKMIGRLSARDWPSVRDRVRLALDVC